MNALRRLDEYSVFIKKEMELPLVYNKDEDYRTFICKYLDDYKSKVIELGGMDEEETNKLEGIVNGIKEAINEYYKGYPAKAYTSLERGMEYIQEIDRYLKATVQNDLYRLRINTDGTSTEYSQGEMFHIPFNLRTMVSTQRYSIPGLPSIYLGSTMYVCWEELGRPPFNTLNAALFSKTDRTRLNVINLGVHPKVISGFVEMDEPRVRPEETLKEANSYLLFWPLIAACSVKVNMRKHSFKPEYIVPQLLLQYVTRNEQYDGIKYLSVHNYPEKTHTDLLHNYVFPAKTIEGRGHCTRLKSSFKLTEGIPWQMYEIYSGSMGGAPAGEEYTHGLRYNIGGDEVRPYGFTNFGRFERYLKWIVEAKVFN